MDESEWRRRLRLEIERWRSEGLIDDALAQTLLEDTGGPAPTTQRRSPTGAVVAMLGAALLGVGVIAFFASNWQAIPGWAKLGSIVAAMVAAYTSGYRLRYKGSTYHGTGNALMFLGMPIFGATLFLVAQGYNVNAGSSSLLWLWALGVVPMALLLVSRIQMISALLMVGVALGMETVEWAPMVPALVLSCYLVYGPLVCALGEWMERRNATEPLGLSTESLGNLIALWALVPLGFRGVLSYVDGDPAGGYEGGFLLRAGALVAIAIGMTGLAWRTSPRTKIDHALGAVRFGTILLAVVPFVVHLNPVAWTILTNLWSLGLAIGLIALGFARRQAVLVNQAVLFFTIQTGCRYVDLFWETLPPEVFFLTMGALLLFGGMAIERGRRRLIGRLAPGVEGGGL